MSERCGLMAEAERTGVQVGAALECRKGVLPRIAAHAVDSRPNESDSQMS
jgi:hypothetical protein